MRLNTEERRRLRLMEWLVKQGPGLQNVGPLYEVQPRAFELSRDDVKHLEAEGLVTSYFAGGMLAQAQATSDGRAWVEDVQARRDDRIERRWSCRTGLVQWLVAVGADSENALTTWDAFYGDARADFYGKPFTADEVDAGAAWLQDKGLIDGIPVEERQRPISAYLTNTGLDCTEHFGGDVRRYMSEKRQVGMGGTNVNITAGGHVQVATGSGSTQNIEVHEVAAQIRLEVTGLVEILKAFGIGGAEELETLYEDAIEGLSGDEPTEVPLHRFSERARGLAGRIGNTAVAAAVSALITALATNAHLLTAIH